MSEGVNYEAFVLLILLFYIFIVASIGYLIGYILSKKVRPEYVGIGSAVYWATALSYLAVVNDRWSRTFSHENPVFWYPTFVVFRSVFVVLFMNLTYVIKRYRLKHSKQEIS